MENKLMLGVARRDITPKVGCNLFGYQPDVISNKVNDNLETVAFVFKQGNLKCAMISITICVLGNVYANSIREKISKEFDIPFDNILLCATHTHSGPITANQPGWGDVDEEYINEIFVPGIMGAVKEAAEKLTYVQMGMAFGDSFVGCNRRELDENNEIILGQSLWSPFNPQMTVISFRDEAGKVIANMVHYGCHCTGAGKNLEISRDWAGVMTDRLEAESGAITAFFNGPEGDVGPRLSNGMTTGINDIKYAMELGAIAAYDAVNIYKKISHYCDIDLGCTARDLELELSPRLPLEVAKAKFAEFDENVTNVEAQQRKFYENVIASYEKGEKEEKYRKIPQTVIKLGDVAFAGFAYEMFAEIGMRINKMSSIGQVLSLSCANGTEGYFPTEDQLCRGGYEVIMFQTKYAQPYAPNADFNLIKETLKNLEALD